MKENKGNADLRIYVAKFSYGKQSRVRSQKQLRGWQNCLIEVLLFYYRFCGICGAVGEFTSSKYEHMYCVHVTLDWAAEPLWKCTTSPIMEKRAMANSKDFTILSLTNQNPPNVVQTHVFTFRSLRIPLNSFLVSQGSPLYYKQNNFLKLFDL